MLDNEIVSFYYGRYQHLWLKLYNTNKTFKTFYMGDHRDVCINLFGMDYNDVCSLLRSRFYHVKEYAKYHQINFFKEVDKYAAIVLLEKLSERETVSQEELIYFLLNEAPSSYLDISKKRRDGMYNKIENMFNFN